MSMIYTQLLVIKRSPLYDTQGFVTPVLSMIEGGEFEAIDKAKYPGDIFISKGYSEIDKQFDVGELFLLKSHALDEEKTQEKGILCYWADDSMFSSIAPNSLIPVLATSLPCKESGALSQGVEPPLGAFFILDGAGLYGPLKSSSTEDAQYVVEPYPHPSLSFGRGFLGAWSVNDIQDCFVKVNVNNEQQMFIKSFKHLAALRSVEKIDFLSDDQLIKVANQTYFGKKALSKKEAEKLQQVIANFEKENKSLKDERLERLKSMLDKYLSDGNNGHLLIKEYLDGGAGQKFLNQYVKDNESYLLQGVLKQFQKEADIQKQEIEKEINYQKTQITKYKDEIEKIQEQVKDKRIAAQEELERIAQETEEQRQKKLAENQAELSEKISQMEQKLKDTQSELDRMCESLKVANDIDKLKKECDYYDMHKSKIESLVDGYKDAITENDSTLYKRIGEMQAINGLINGKTDKEVDIQPKELKPLPISSNQPESIEDIIDYLCANFNDGGRSFSSEEMTNLMVCLQQSFLTVLAGAPGTGKTSTVTRLAKAMNFGSGRDGDHFLNIPVGRGWVSTRDILGFYNSLKDTYQESRSGLYSFLSHHQQNPTDANKIILLDEANLSSIEHYWSDFLLYCDRENLTRPIDTGIPNPEQRHLVVDDMTRFVATINFDSTTEPLSPRLIDRVPVITLEHPEFDFEVDTSSLSLDGMVKASLLNKLISTEDNALLRAEKALLLDTVDILSKADRNKGPAVHISQRKLNAIANYVGVSRDLIGSDTAMDFALSQFVLPHIDGYGTAFKNRLEELHEKVSKYNKTNNHLERILASGDYLSGSYSFFG